MKILQKKQQLPNRRTHSASPREGRASAEELSARYAFRRNRTLTGSLVSEVGSAGEHRSELRSPRVQAHHLRRHRRRLGLVFLAVIAISAGLFWLVYQSVAGVRVTIDAPIPPTETTLYEQKIQEYLSNHLFERTRATLNTEALVEHLQSNGLPETLAATVAPRPAGVGVSTITLKTRRPVVSWKTGPSQLFVDGQGVAFQRNYYAMPGVEVADETGIQAVDNKVLASDRFLGFIGLAVSRLEAQGFTASKVVLPADTTRQLLVSIEGLPYQVKFSVDRSAGEQAEDAARAVRYLAGKGITPEYLDVRVPGKAYYK